jgi:predicted Zn-dependent protease
MDRIENLRSFLSGRPNDRFARYSLALELDKAGKRDEALREMRELLQRHPTSGAGHFQYGRMLLVAGQPEAARRAWTEGLAALRGVIDPEARRSVGEIQQALDALESEQE